MRRPDSIVSARTQPPDHHLGRVQLGPLVEVAQDAIPQSIRRGRVRRVSGTVRRAGNLSDNSRPAAREDLVRALAVVRPVAVQSCHDQHYGDGVGLVCARRGADVDGDVRAVVAGAVGVRHDHLVDGLGPEAGCLQVGLFLALKGYPLDGVGLGDVHVGEARNAVDDRGAAEEV